MFILCIVYNNNSVVALVVGVEDEVAGVATAAADGDDDGDGLTCPIHVPGSQGGDVRGG